MEKLFSIRPTILAGSLVLQLSPLCFHSRGAAGDVDLSFRSDSGVNGPVFAVVLPADGKVINGGGGITVKGLARIGVARLNADGSGDSSFTAEACGLPLGDVYALALQPDGKGGVSHEHGFSRLNSEGSLDKNCETHSEVSL